MSLLKGLTLRIKTIKHQLILNVGIKCPLSFFNEKTQ